MKELLILYYYVDTCGVFVAHEIHVQQYGLHIDAFYIYEFSVVETITNQVIPSL